MAHVALYSSDAVCGSHRTLSVALSPDSSIRQHLIPHSCVVAGEVSVGPLIEQALQESGAHLTTRADGTDFGSGVGCRLKVDPAALPLPSEKEHLHALSVALKAVSGSGYVELFRSRLRCNYTSDLTRALAEMHRCGLSLQASTVSQIRRALVHCLRE